MALLGYRLVVVRGEQQLSEHQLAWQDLARHAAEPNAFYEPWCLLPALRAFGRGLDLRFVLVYEEANEQRHPAVLCGFFPLQAHRLHPLLPVRVLSQWRHDHCFLSTPLLRATHGPQVLEAFFHFLRNDPEGAALWRLDMVSGEGEFTRALTQLWRRRPGPSFAVESFCRAIFQPSRSAEDYVGKILSHKHLKAHRKKEKTLAQQGRLEHRFLGPTLDSTCVETWIEAFLGLETSGWKGREGTALASRAQDRAFFTEMMQQASRRGRLLLQGLYLDGQPVALKCILLASTSPEGPGFAFKIAYDEAHARYSPGVLLELAGIRHLHEHRLTSWIDSCTSAEPTMFDRLWSERRLMQTLYLATGRAPGDLLVSLMPLGRWCKSWLRLQGNQE